MSTRFLVEINWLVSYHLVRGGRFARRFCFGGLGFVVRMGYLYAVKMLWGTGNHHRGIPKKNWTFL